MPVEGAPLALNLLPMGSAFFLRRVLAGAGGGQDAPAAPRGVAAGADRETAQLTGKIVAGTAVFGLASGFMETYGSDPGMATTPAIR